MITPPTRPKARPKYWALRIRFLNKITTKTKVMIGEREVMMTLPAPAKPYLIPKNELIINAMFKIELPRTYFIEE